MKIIKPKFIITCNKKYEIFEDCAVLFDEKFKEISTFDKLINKFPNAKVEIYDDLAMLPAFYNPHVHLEFSANFGNLIYGDFMIWLSSVIKNRNHLSKEVNSKIILKAINEMKKSGVAGFGEISSFFGEVDECKNCDLRVVFFVEILGANDEFFEQNIINFNKKIEKISLFKNENFTPAVSLHSPYSSTKKLAKYTTNFAKVNDFLISTHFLESVYEKKWLKNGDKNFKKWLQNFNKNPKPQFNEDEFLQNFSGLHTLFTHCNYFDNFEKFEKNHFVSHCIRSNKLLGSKILNFKKIQNFDKVNIATDGLSSNNSLNFFDELRANLFMHNEFNLQKMAKILLRMATFGGANALNYKAGEISSDFDADFSLVKCQNSNKNSLCVNLILNTKSVEKLFVKGKEIKFENFRFC